MKEAIVTAMAQVGQDGHGFNGLVGYVRGLILRSDQAGASLVRIVVPLTLNAPASGPLSAYKTEEDIRAEFALKGIPFEVIHRLEFHRPEDVEDDVLDQEGPATLARAALRAMVLRPLPVFLAMSSTKEFSF
jgi:hypothetical protein